MSRQFPLVGILVTVATVALTGCHPQQPFYFHEDGDLSHYLDVATDVDYPDVEAETLGEVDGAVRPFSLDNSRPKEIWELTLEDAVQYALANSKVMKSIGGQIQGSPDFLTRSPELAQTVYDPAIIETNPRLGIEAALSAFDTQFSASMFWEKFDTPRNTTFNFIGTQRDTGNFQARLRKTAATGGTYTLTHNVLYEQSDSPIRRYPSDWNVNLEAEFRQPLLQGGGVQFNRIAGPGSIPGFNNGVMVARINTDIALADFEAGVQDLVSDVEVAYWELYYGYRFLDAMIAGRDSGLRTWREMEVKLEVGSAEALEEARARQQFYLFRGAMERALHSVYAAESKLRYLIGLAATDGRLIRPKNEPKMAMISFDWNESMAESLSRNVDLRRQKWVVKRRELEMIAAKNYLLPRLDATGTYRWLGLGDEMIESSGGTGNPALFGSNAYQSMTGGDFQEWQFGFEFSMPIGFRKEMAGVRHAQLNVARERARLQEQELEVSHQLAYAIRELEAHHTLAQTNFNRRVAAKLEVETANAKMEAGLVEYTLDAVLDAQRRLAEAEADFYRSVVDYNKAIAQVHFRKGSLLEYNGVYLTEGPWPGKAYFDAHNRARARDASMYLDYGFTRPKVISRGPYEQHAGSGGMVPGDGTVFEQPFGDGPLLLEGETEAGEGPAEIIETPAGTPIEGPDPASRPEPPVPGPFADPQTSRPPVGPGKLAGKAAAPGGAGRSYDLGLMKLEQLARSPVAKKPAGDGQWSAVNRQVSHHETVANPPAVGTDRPASGWKRVQR